MVLKLRRIGIDYKNVIMYWRCEMEIQKLLHQATILKEILEVCLNIKEDEHYTKHDAYNDLIEFLKKMNLL